MNGIGQKFRAPENNTTGSTIENNSLPVHRRAWCYQTKTTKKPAVTRAYVVFLLFSARQYETLNHSHSIVSETLNPSVGEGLLAVCSVNTMKNTIEKSPVEVLGVHVTSCVLIGVTSVTSIGTSTSFRTGIAARVPPRRHHPC